MDTINTVRAAKQYLSKLEEDTDISPSTLKGYRSVLNRLNKFSPELPATREAFEKYLGNPATTSLDLRIRRYDVANRFLKSGVEQDLGLANICDEVPRPLKVMEGPRVEKSSTKGPAEGRIDTREAVGRHLERLRKSDKSKATIANYQRVLGRLIQAAPTLPATDEQLYEAMGDPDHYASATRRLHYNAMSGLFHSPEMTAKGLADSLANVEKPKKGKKRKRIYTEDEVVRLVAAADTPLTEAMVLLLLNTGIRIGELASLSLEDVEDGFATVDGKTGERVIPLAPEIEEKLRDLANADGVIWFDEHSPLDVKQLTGRYRTVARRAGLPKVKWGPHTARHTFATMWLRNGGKTRTLQMIMGHKDLKTTEEYLQFVQDDVVRDQARYAPTAALGLLRPGPISGGRRSAGDGVFDRDASGFPHHFPLFFDPVALVQAQAERDRKALVQIAVEFLQQETCIELPVGRPLKELPQEVAAMVDDDVEAGYTKSAIIRKYKKYYRFSRTYLSDIIKDGRLKAMAKRQP